MNKGILIRGGADEVIESRARREGLGVYPFPSNPPVLRQAQEPGESYPLPSPPPKGEGVVLPWEKTLIVQAGTRVPWDLLPAAWHFLDRWDAAVPLWKYGVLAADVGTAQEREATQAVVRDLRVLLHSVELLFVRRNVPGVTLMAAWDVACAKFEKGERRLAFLRAVYQVKPRLCVLPTTWLAEVRQATGGGNGNGRRRPASQGTPMVTVEVAPGKLIKCHAGDEARIVAQYAERKERGGDMAVLSNKSFVTENQRTRSSKGPLVRVEIGKRVVKMYEADAIKAGLIQGKQKLAEENKIRPADEEKTLAPALSHGERAPDSTSAGSVADDLTVIDGIGQATARLLAANGIGTFEQLRGATELGFLSSQAQQAVEAWRNG